MATSFQNESAIQEWETVFDKTFMSVIKNVYLWMCAGLFITAFVSIWIIYPPLNSIWIKILDVPFLFFGLLICELALVIWLTARIGKISITASRIGFLVYAILNGITTSVIFLLYTQSSIALTFLTTASLFGIMSVIGYNTKLDLSKWRSFLLMGLFGLIMGTIFNTIFANSALEWGLTYGGIGLFIGLTVYDTQKIKNMVSSALKANNENLVKEVGLLGALNLYLDFINLFLLILNLFGKRRSN